MLKASSFPSGEVLPRIGRNNRILFRLNEIFQSAAREKLPPLRKEFHRFFSIRGWKYIRALSICPTLLLEQVFRSLFPSLYPGTKL